MFFKGFIMGIWTDDSFFVLYGQSQKARKPEMWYTHIWQNEHKYIYNESLRDESVNIVDTYSSDRSTHIRYHLVTLPHPPSALLMNWMSFLPSYGPTTTIPLHIDEKSIVFQSPSCLQSSYTIWDRIGFWLAHGPGLGVDKYRPSG